MQFASIVGGVEAVTSGTAHADVRFASSKELRRRRHRRPISSTRRTSFDVQPAAAGQIAKLTDVNGDVLQGKQLAKIEEMTYTSTGNAEGAWAGSSSRRRSTRRRNTR